MIIAYEKGIVTITPDNDSEKHILDYVFSDPDGMYPLIKRYINDKGQELNDKNQESLSALIDGNNIADVIQVLTKAKSDGVLK